VRFAAAKRVHHGLCGDARRVLASFGGRVRFPRGTIQRGSLEGPGSSWKFRPSARGQTIGDLPVIRRISGGYVGFLAHRCALKGEHYPLLAGVSPRAFSMGRHARTLEKKSRISRILNSRGTGDHLPSLPFHPVRLPVTDTRLRANTRLPRDAPCRGRVRLNSSAKLSPFPPEASFADTRSPVH